MYAGDREAWCCVTEGQLVTESGGVWGGGRAEGGY
jgi:hypothetical protein